MGDVINLNKFRKAKARASKATTAEANRRKHGRSASERAQETAGNEKRKRELDGKRLEPTE